ncbi:MAG: DUF4384 domain-containing protein [Trueperaceae bacterium]|nr:DUF4384 domain-containing protein [Trueperaceae bacterium]
MLKQVKIWFSLAVLVALLSSCTVTFLPSDVSISGRVRFGIELNDVISDFRPDRGAGASYRVGDSIGFLIRTNQSGYVTLTEIDPYGNVQTFGRNIAVGAGTTVINGPDARSEFAVGSSSVSGLHRVRVSFTPSPTDTTRVTYRGVIGEDGWTNIIVTDVTPYNIRDIAETTYYIQ